MPIKLCMQYTYKKPILHYVHLTNIIIHASKNVFHLQYPHMDLMYYLHWQDKGSLNEEQ
jgi:hypothetical protein